MNRTMWRGFLLLESALWVGFMAADLLNWFDTTGMKYASILLIMLVATIFANVWKGKIVAAALVVTAAADWFLLVLDQHYAAGICLFCVVQLLYAVRLGNLRSSWIGILIVLVPFCVFRTYGIVNGLAAGYIILFAVNLTRAGMRSVRSKESKYRLFFAGLALYFLCDLCVGLYHTASGAVSEFARFGMWAFYLPGQLLILASAIDVDVKEKTA